MREKPIREFVLDFLKEGGEIMLQKTIKSNRVSKISFGFSIFALIPFQICLLMIFGFIFYGEFTSLVLVYINQDHFIIYTGSFFISLLVSIIAIFLSLRGRYVDKPNKVSNMSIFLSLLSLFLQIYYKNYFFFTITGAV